MILLIDIDRKCFIIFSLFLIPSFSYAQESAEINYDGCENEMIHQNVYAPFYYHITHDPVISHNFEQRHDDNPNVNPFIRTPPENIEPGYPTWVEFGTNSNQTAIYEFELGLEYAEDIDSSRPVNIQLFSANGLMMERKIFLEDKINCIAFRVNAVPQPHQFTYEEILEIAKSEFIGHVKQFADSVDRNTYETTGLKQSIIIVIIVFSMVVAFLIIDNRNRKKEMQTLRDEYKIRNDLLATSILKSDASIQFQKLSTITTQKSFESMRDSMIGNFGVLLQKMQESVDSSKNEFIKLIKQLRHEIEVYEPVVEKPVTTFADLEKRDDSPLVIDSSELKEPDKSIGVSNPMLKEVFGFDLSQLKNIVKPVMNIGKKEPEISDMDKLRKKWSMMSNEELYNEYSDYVRKSTDDMIKNKAHGFNFDCTKELLDIINQRQTDVKKGE